MDPASRLVPAPAPVVRLLPQLAEFARRTYGDSPFLLRWTSGGWQSTSFAAAATAVHAFARLLEREGVRPGDRVALQSENRPEWGLAYLAILEAGAVVVPLDVLLTEQEVGEMLAASAATHAVASARQLETMLRARAARRPELRLVTLDPAEGLPGWDEAQALFPDAAPAPPRAEPHELASLLFTSGTTGQAKGVMLSHSNLLHNVEAVAAGFCFGPADRMLSVLPLHHAFECTAGFLCPIRVGASVAYARSLKSGNLLEDLRTSRATIMLGVPLLYEKLLQGIERGVREAPFGRRIAVQTLLGLVRMTRLATGQRLGSAVFRSLRERAGLGHIRMFVSGAASLPAEVFFGLADLGLPAIEGYGLSECSPVVAANRPERSHSGSVGWPLPGIEVRLDRPDAEGTGEVLVRGPNVMLGYLGDPAGTAEVLREGWFSTGDLGRRTADGRLAITGRLKNMIATAAGKKIYPEEVEVHLAGSPYVLEVVVMGGRDARGEREEVHAHVLPDRTALEALARARGQACDDAFIEATLQHEIHVRCQMLAPYKRVRRVIVRREPFPRTTTGKIRRPSTAPDAAERRIGAVA